MTSYFLCADVLGFSSLVHNLDHPALEERLEDWIKLVNHLKSQTSLTEVLTVSDSLYAMVDDTEEDLERLLRFSQSLLEQGIDSHFPIRGAITRGDVTWSDTIYGGAVIEALALEKSQDWVGISCESGINVPWSWDLVCTYLVPKKENFEVRLTAAVIWDIPETQEFIRKCCANGYVRDGELMQWHLYSKLENTMEFAAYLERARRHVLHPSKYDKSVGKLLGRTIF